MSERPESDPTTESQRFLQRRVARFGLVGGLGGLAFWLFNLLGVFFVPDFAAQASASMLFHLVGAASLIVVWALCGWQPRSRRFVHQVESVGLMTSGVAYSLMGAYMPVAVLRPDLVVLLAMNFGMMARAVLVPSTALRTATLTALVGIPIIGANLLASPGRSSPCSRSSCPSRSRRSRPSNRRPGGY